MFHLHALKAIAFFFLGGGQNSSISPDCDYVQELLWPQDNLISVVTSRPSYLVLRSCATLPNVSQFFLGFK